jgi:DNA-binding MarR family transcriptional regulator
VIDATTSGTAQRVLDELGALIRQLTRITGGPDQEPALTATQRLTLFELAEHGPLRVGDVAARLGITPPTASRAIDALEAHGWVQRVADPDDRRALQIGITDKGRTRVRERKAQILAAFEPAAAALSADELSALEALLARLREGLGAGGVEAERRTA